MVRSGQSEKRLNYHKMFARGFCAEIQTKGSLIVSQEPNGPFLTF